MAYCAKPWYHRTPCGLAYLPELLRRSVDCEHGVGTPHAVARFPRCCGIAVARLDLTDWTSSLYKKKHFFAYTAAATHTEPKRDAGRLPDIFLPLSITTAQGQHLRVLFVEQFRRVQQYRRKHFVLYVCYRFSYMPIVAADEC
jgi:hypothetical protein